MADSEHALYHEVMEAQGWADPDPAVCRCGGSGWVLSSADAWYACRFHEGPHPEAEGEPERACRAGDTGCGETPCVCQPGEDDCPACFYGTAWERHTCRK